MNFKIGDYVKVIQLTVQDNELHHKIKIGDIGIVEFIDNNEVYVKLSNNKHCLLYDTQLELYKQNTYNGFDSSEFNTDQMDEIRKDPEAGIDVSQYADSKFDYSQIITEEDFMKSCIDSTIDEFIRNPNKTTFTNFDAIRNNLSSNSEINTNSLKTHKE